MSIVASEVGIDVSLAELVTSIDQGKPFKASNTERGVGEIAVRLPTGCRVHVESTGGYERLLVRGLRKAGFDVRVHNPLNARRISQGRGRRAKTDEIDAKELCLSGPLLPSRKPKADDRQDLTDFSRAIDNAKETIAQYKKRRKMPGLDSDARAFYDELIKALAAKVKDAEEKIAQRLKESAYRADYELAKSVMCIGPVAARVCICELPENVKLLPTSHASSYAGIAPLDDSSGKTTGPSRIGHGNARLKRALYMCAIAALSKEPWARNLYKRLLAKGRSHEQAMVPIMRRLLLRVVCVLKRGSAWQAEPPNH